MSSYVGSFLGRLPARPAPATSLLPPMPQGRIGLSSAPPRPPGHPSTPEATQPGPHPMGAGGGDMNMQMPARPQPPMLPEPQPPQLTPLERFLLASTPHAV